MNHKKIVRKGFVGGQVNSAPGRVHNVPFRESESSQFFGGGEWEEH
jgi:hypothetical protein